MLDASASREVGAHVESCPRCERHAEELRSVSRLVAALPRLDAPEPVARVALRLGSTWRRAPPALALLFRGFWPRRGRSCCRAWCRRRRRLRPCSPRRSLALDSGPLPEVHLAPGAWARPPASGTEGNPLFPSAEVQLPQRASALGCRRRCSRATARVRCSSRPIVARDGSVADVTLLEGDAARRGRPRRGPAPAALRAGALPRPPVAVSVYRLISRMDVRSPRT